LDVLDLHQIDKVDSIIKFSLQQLSEQCQKVFYDVITALAGVPVDGALYAWSASLPSNPGQSTAVAKLFLQQLQQKSLITISQPGADGWGSALGVLHQGGPHIHVHNEVLLSGRSIIQEDHNAKHRWLWSEPYVDVQVSRHELCKRFTP